METKQKSRSLRVSFKPGLKQSFRANNYFVTLGNEMVDGLVKELKPRQYRLMITEGDEMALLIWSNQIVLDENTKDYFSPWIMQLIREIDLIASGKLELGGLRDIVERWIRPSDPRTTYFIEHMQQSHGKILWKYQPKHSFIVLGGRICMVSSRKMLFAEVQEGLCGLSIIGKGSYLFETG